MIVNNLILQTKAYAYLILRDYHVESISCSASCRWVKGSLIYVERKINQKSKVFVSYKQNEK